MTATPLNTPKFRAFTNAGAPLTGGKVYTYAAGTSTPKSSWTDYSASVANANPVILNANGEADIWLDGNYKIVLKDSADVTQWTEDNISSLTSQISYAGGTTTGTADALIVNSVTPTNFTLIENASVYIIPIFDNTGAAATVNIASTGAKTLLLGTVSGLSTPYAGSLKANIPALLVYNGTNWVLTASITNLPPYFDTTIILKNAVDATKQAIFSLASLATATTRTYTLPNANTTIVGTDVSQILTNKNLVDNSTRIVGNADATKIGVINASNISPATTRQYDLPNVAGVLSIIGANSIAANGYVFLYTTAAGARVCLQWGIDNSVSANKTITYPIAFPTGTLAVMITPIDQNPNFYINGTPSTTTYNVIFSTGSKHYWWAVGN